jgi:aminopeptidase N
MLDKSNPQVAARFLTPLTRWRRYDPRRQGLMRAALERIGAEDELSKDVFEIVGKSLAVVDR